MVVDWYWKKEEDALQTCCCWCWAYSLVLPNLERETSLLPEHCFLCITISEHIASLPYLTINVSCIITGFAAFLGNSSLEWLAMRHGSYEFWMNVNKKGTFDVAQEKKNLFLSFCCYLQLSASLAKKKLSASHSSEEKIALSPLSNVGFALLPSRKWDSSVCYFQTRRTARMP